MVKSISLKEREAIERFLDCLPETIIARRLWDAGYRIEDTYSDGALRLLGGTVYATHIYNCFRQWERETEQGYNHTITPRRLGGMNVGIDTIPTEIPTVKPKITSR